MGVCLMEDERFFPGNEIEVQFSIMCDNIIAGRRGKNSFF